MHEFDRILAFAKELQAELKAELARSIGFANEPDPFGLVPPPDGNWLERPWSESEIYGAAPASQVKMVDMSNAFADMISAYSFADDAEIARHAEIELRAHRLYLQAVCRGRPEAPPPMVDGEPVGRVGLVVPPGEGAAMSREAKARKEGALRPDHEIPAEGEKPLTPAPGEEDEE